MVQVEVKDFSDALAGDHMVVGMMVPVVLSGHHTKVPLGEVLIRHRRRYRYSLAHVHISVRRLQWLSSDGDLHKTFHL